MSGGMLLFGDPKVGKSYAALQLACCLTSGTDWLEFTIPAPVKVVYVQLDTPRGVWADRVQELQDSGHPVEGVHFADRETLQTFPFDILNDDHFRLLRNSLHEINPGAVIMDTLRESHSANENDSTEMQKTIARLEEAVKPAALILISHARKSNPEVGYDLMNDNRGSNYVVGRMDAICRFSKTSMRVSSRTTEEHSIKLDRQTDGTWDLIEDQFAATAKGLLRANPEMSIRGLARILHETPGIERSETACRSWLKRHLKKKSPGSARSRSEA